MDKGALGIAGLVAGILGVVAGGFAYMQANKALDRAGEAIMVAEDASAGMQGPAEIRKAVREEIVATKTDLEKMVADVRVEIRKLEAQAERADILTEAKRHADGNAERNAEALITQVKALEQEISSGDQETKAHYDQLKADLEKAIAERDEAIKRLVIRWLESGTM